VRNTYAYNWLKNEIGKCELCGSRLGLEVHHIIPKVCEIGGVDLEQDDNLIVVCAVCHTKLTPRALLTKYGICKLKRTQQQRLLRFYEELDARKGDFDAIEVMNLVDEIWGCNVEGA
jgi:5-methylcytosine-specific restriction endonuclease McrA